MKFLFKTFKPSKNTITSSQAESSVNVKRSVSVNSGSSPPKNVLSRMLYRMKTNTRVAHNTALKAKSTEQYAVDQIHENNGPECQFQTARLPCAEDTPEETNLSTPLKPEPKNELETPNIDPVDILQNELVEQWRCRLLSATGNDFSYTLYRLKASLEIMAYTPIDVDLYNKLMEGFAILKKYKGKNGAKEWNQRSHWFSGAYGSKELLESIFAASSIKTWVDSIKPRRKHFWNRKPAADPTKVMCIPFAIGYYISQTSMSAPFMGGCYHGFIPDFDGMVDPHLTWGVGRMGGALLEIIGKVEPYRRNLQKEMNDLKDMMASSM